MIAQEVAKRYSAALFMSTQERGLVDEAYDQFSGLKTAMEQDDSLLKFLASPRVEEDQKLQLLRTVFGERMERLFVEFLVVLVRRRRAAYLIEVIDEFNRRVEFQKGINRVTVMTAIPISPEEESALVSTLATKSGKTIELEKKVDPRIIGGMIVIMADKIIDGSIRHGLGQLKEKLHKIKVH
jgi:F-type H+-transporting ATPase subunit delta